MLTAVLVRQAAAAMGVRTYWSWETAATLPSARQHKALWRPRRGEAGAYRGAARLQLVTVMIRHYHTAVFWVSMGLDSCTLLFSSFVLVYLPSQTSPPDLRDIFHTALARYGRFNTNQLTTLLFVVTLCAKLSGTVYCNRSCLWVCGGWCLWRYGRAVSVTR